MPTERMEEVEVVCGACNSTGIWTVLTGVYFEIPATGDPGAGPRKFTTTDQPCNTCGGSLTQRLPVAPNSLTSARLRLADAAEKWFKAARSRVRNGQPDHALDEAWMAFQRECEALHTTRGT